MHKSQQAQFKRTNIKVVKAPGQATQGNHQSSSMPPTSHRGSQIKTNVNTETNVVSAGQKPRVINISMFEVENADFEEGAVSLGPPLERTSLNHPTGTFKQPSVSQEPQTVRSVNNKRQLNFGGVKKVINTNQEAFMATSDQMMGPNSTTSNQKHKLYLPKKGGAPGQPMIPPQSGVQIQDGHRRRLQALAAAQHSGATGQHTQVLGSVESGHRDPSSFNTNMSSQKRGGGETSTSTQGNTARMKVISKKLITLSTKKVQGRNAVAMTHLTQNVVASSTNVISHAKKDSKSMSASRPAALNLNFNPSQNVPVGPSSGVSTMTNQNLHTHNSALSRFNANPNLSLQHSSKKQAPGTQAIPTYRQNTQMKKNSSGHASVVEQPAASAHSALNKLEVPVHTGLQPQPQHMGSIKIRQEVSPNRTAYNTQPAAARKKYPQMHQGGLGYRRHQIIQDITEDTSPSATNMLNYNQSQASQHQQLQYSTRKMHKQSSESSMKSLKQITQQLTKQSDLKKVFYAKVSQSPSNKSINTMQSNQSSGGPPSSQPSQQFTLTKKASLISQGESASTSRERTLNFKLKKHGQHGQLQNNNQKRQGVIQLQQQQINQHANMIPTAANKRRPLVIRKNNFVLTKRDESSADSNPRDASGHIAPGSTSNASGVSRVLINPLGQGVQNQKNKLNMTLHSNNSGNRALNNTQKIGRAGQGGHGINSNDSLGSEASLSQTRNQLGKSIAAVNASIKKAQYLQQSSDLATQTAISNTSAIRGGSSSKLRTSDASMEKLPSMGTNSSSQQPSSRLIKVNRSKKKLDTARRSRIQQLKDINLVDHSGPQHPLQQTQQFNSTLQSQSRGIPQLNKNNSNELVNKPKITTPNNKQILQVQTDFSATLPMHVHNPAGSVTIKADHSRQTKPGSVEQAASQEKATTNQLNVSTFNTASAPGHHQTSGVRTARNQNQQSSTNGLRPVRLFNYATQHTAPRDEMSGGANKALTNRNSNQREKEQNEKFKSATGPVKYHQGQPTPSSTKSQKSLRRGQIFRKQTRKNSQINDESSLASKENNTTNGQAHEVLTHITTPTDPQNASSTHLPLKNRRSNQLLSQRQVDSDKNQQSASYLGGISKPESRTNKSGQPEGTQALCAGQDTTHYNSSTVSGKAFLNPRKHILKQFDSDPQLDNKQKLLVQETSTEDLQGVGKMKNDHSELIVPKTTNLINNNQNSSERIIPHVEGGVTVGHQGQKQNTRQGPTQLPKRNTNQQVLKSAPNEACLVNLMTEKPSCEQIEVGAAVIVESSANTDTLDAKEEESKAQMLEKGQSVRRSLERVESIKNLLEHDHGVGIVEAGGFNVTDQKEVSDDDEVKVGEAADVFDRSQMAVSDPASNEATDKPQTVFDKKALVLAPMDSGRNSQDIHTFKTHGDELTARGQNLLDESGSASGSGQLEDDCEPSKPDLNGLTKQESTSEAQNQAHLLQQHLQHPDQEQSQSQIQSGPTVVTANNNQQDELRIQHNDTLPPPGPSAASNQFSNKVKKSSGQGLVNKFSVTKGSDLTRELLTQTADTSNRKTISNQRAYCNSSDSRVNVVNTAFSFKSQTSPECQEVPQFPMTPQQALIYLGNQLTEYEKKEILDYPEIYFVGAPTAQKVQASSQLEHNYGYDDEKGDYKIITNDHIGYRFEIKSFLGKGSFGTALKCMDHKTGLEVAVKVVKNKKKYYYQAGVELKILQFLKENDPEDIMNVIHLNDYVIFRKHLCIGFELMSMNLFEFLKINDFNGFDHNLIRRFAIQLLYALKYLKMFQIIHCDLKPENILLKESNKSGIKIIDFGSSTFLDERVYTYIQSRFYRAPEIMLGIPYDTAIDMWSFGCIMAELYIGYPIFPGDSENDQMSRLMEMVDVPDATVLSMSSRKDKFFTKAPDGSILDPIMCKNSRGKLRKPMGKPLALVIGDEDPDFTDFVQRCLTWNPHERLSPDEALKHVWILKGLPPQVLIHHQKMHNIHTPELPSQVLKTRDDFIEEQKSLQRQQELQEMQQMQKQQQLQQMQQKRTDKTPASPKNTLMPHAQNSQERSQGKIRLKRTVPGNQVSNKKTKQVYQTTQGGRPPVLPQAQVVLQPGLQPAQPQTAYPGSTKSSQSKGKQLGQGGKLHFKISQQQNSNVGQGRQPISNAPRQLKVATEVSAAHQHIPTMTSSGTKRQNVNVGYKTAAASNAHLNH